jgi:hypothetical protein
VILSDDERGADHADAQAREEVRFPARHEAGARHCDGAEQEQVDVALAGTDPVAQVADPQPREDGDSHRSDEGGDLLGFAEIQVGANGGGQQGCVGKPPKETNEECQPGEMKRLHLHRLDAKEVYLGRFSVCGRHGYSPPSKPPRSVGLVQRGV